MRIKPILIVVLCFGCIACSPDKDPKVNNETNHSQPMHYETKKMKRKTDMEFVKSQLESKVVILNQNSKNKIGGKKKVLIPIYLRMMNPLKLKNT